MTFTITRWHFLIHDDVYQLMMKVHRLFRQPIRSRHALIFYFQFNRILAALRTLHLESGDLLFIFKYFLKMPQLKKISISRNNILPKLEFAGESIYTNYEIVHPDITTYLPIYSDTKSSSTGLSSEAEAESDGASSSISCKPRKRQRLDHLSQEEKIMRRKMKNRVAAQTARDRKKARMVELEEQVLELETERKMLMLANMNLQAQNEALQKENEELKQQRLGTVQVKEENSVKQSEEVTEVESRLSDNSRSIEHASFINVPLQKGQDLRLLTLWMMHFAYLPMIARLMIFMIYYNSILMVFSSLKTSVLLFQNFQTLEPLQRAKHQPLKWWGPHQKAWNPTKN